MKKTKFGVGLAVALPVVRDRQRPENESSLREATHLQRAMKAGHEHFHLLHEFALGIQNMSNNRLKTTM